MSARATKATLRLRLFVVADAPNSRRAVRNLRRMLSALSPDAFDRMEVVDVLDNPGAALSEGIIVTPTLQRLEPLPKVIILGDLSDTDRVIASLGLEADTA